MSSSRRTVQLVGAALAVGLLWSYWPVLAGIADRWATDPKYSHGYIVPLFALGYFFYRFRLRTNPDRAGGWTLAPSGLLRRVGEEVRAFLRADLWDPSWLGLPLLVAGVLMHAAGMYFYIDWLGDVSLLLSLGGLCWCLGGWRLFLLAAPSIGFLVFMLPLPFQAEVALANPLQRAATVVSTYVLQTIGFSVSSQGNTILLNSGPIEVAEACSGLGMLVTFAALATAVALVINRPLLDRLVVLASAVPVAVLSNIIRITVTGILYETWSAKVAQDFFHLMAGLFMMPLALLIIGAELWVLSHLLVAPPAEAPATDSLGLGLGLAPAAGTPEKKVAGAKASGVAPAAGPPAANVREKKGSVPAV